MVMKKYALLFLILALANAVYAASINAAAYRTMQMQSYRNNYNRQVNNRTMPYWQMQSNYATRNRTYTNYQNYSNYENAVNQYNYERSGRRY